MARGRCAALVKVREGLSGWRRCRSEVGAGQVFCGRHRDVADGVVMGWCVRKFDVEREKKKGAEE